MENKGSPLFTVILSTYNRRDLAPRAIRSVLNQTFSDFEFIIIDNGSTDDTAFIVKEFKDPRIRFLTNPNPTKSCDGPRNMGMEMARGALVAFIDDDDIWYPERLEKVRQAFETHADAAAVCHDENIRAGGKVIRGRRYGPWTPDFFERLMYDGNCMSSCGTTVRVEALRQLGGFDLRREFDAVADYDCWIRMAAADMRVHFINEPLGEYSDTGFNVTTVNPFIGERIAAIVETHILAHEKKILWRVSDRGMKRILGLYLIAARTFLAGRYYRHAAGYLMKSALFLLIRPNLALIFLKR